ncbi:DUF2840 domain-containing protein [Mesorhizobium sp. PUT5]|uniref:DUF2840 domain-containing protein n=1 Tax=Mesorhizobium sp. PUT5 TaxID=3454629 RepID=UPI003FA4C928
MARLAPFRAASGVELTFQKRRIEHRIRFGRKSDEQIIHRRRGAVGFAPENIFAFVRWATGDHGTVVSRIDIMRAISRGEPFPTLPFVRPGGEILLRLDGWPKVQRARRAKREIGFQMKDVTIPMRRFFQPFTVNGEVPALEGRQRFALIDDFLSSGPSLFL